MKTLIYGLFAVAVMGLAFWAYTQNYATQSLLKETQMVRDDMTHLRERLSVLRAEWAYLNRPDRLRDLANLNFDRLKLFPLAPEQFGHVDDIPFPGPPADLIANVIEVRGDLDGGEP